VTAGVAVLGIQKQYAENTARYRSEEMRKTRDKLKNLVDVAYSAIERNHREAQDKDSLEKIYGSRLQDIVGIAQSIAEEMAAKVELGTLTEAQAKEEASKAIRKIRYANGTGYVWINDMGEPLPRMVMHPFSPELDGETLNAPQYNCALGKNENLFKAFVDVCKADGEGFVDYRWPKPKAGTSELIPDVPKLAYVRLFEAWGWVLGTGVYIDDAVVEAAQKSMDHIRKVRYDQGIGYFWINDVAEPFPKMVMHPLSSELEGEVLDDPQYNCVLGKNENLYKASVDVCKVNGEGFIYYHWRRSTEAGQSEPLQKLSYVRLFEPLGWIVGTSVDTDEIDAAIHDQMEIMTVQVNGLIRNVIYFSAVMCGCAIIASIVSAKSISRPVAKLIGTMRAVRNEGISNKRASPGGASEIRELSEIFNKMLDTINGGIENLKKETAAIAKGDFSQRLPARGDNDFLAEVINQLAEQRQKAAEEVKVYTMRLEQRAAIESSLSQMNTSLQGDLSVDEVATQGLKALVTFLESSAGAVFVLESDDRLHRRAAHAYPEEHNLPTSFPLGYGTIGQVAQSGLSKTIEPGNTDLRVSFGFGEVTPKQILITPLLSKGKVVAVVELCLFHLLTDTQSQWLKQATEAIANAFRFAQESDHRKRAQIEFQKLSRAVEQSSSSVVITDVEGRIEYVNPKFTQVTGYTQEEAIGQNPRVLKSDAHAPEFYENLWQTITAGQDWHGEFCNRKKDGTLYWESASISPVRDDAGSVNHFVAVKEDVTERKQAEQALIEAQRAAEAATQAKSDFLANMSHEIRTPMNGIIGMTELTLDTDLTPEQRDYLNTVQSSAEALLTLINDILDFSKIEAGKLELDPIDFALRDSVADMLNTLAVRAHSKGLELAYSVQPEVPDALVGDVYRLRQILMNLVGNAIKFTDKGEIVISVEAQSNKEESHELHFSVRDTGVGIAADKVDKIFKPFEQEDSTTTRKFGGTGLGLTISVQLVEMMGGRIWVESQVGQGSTFHFTTILRQVQGKPKVEQLKKLEALQSLHVLVVDDNTTNRKILEGILKNWHMEPQSVPSGSEALAAVDRAVHAGHPFQLILSDVNMPEMDGFGLFNHLREGSHRDIPFVLLTSAARPGDIARCREIGVAAHLIKPVKQSLLMNAIANSVGHVGEVIPTVVSTSETVDAPAEQTRTLHILLAEDNAVNQKFAVRVINKAGHRVEIANNGVEAVTAWEQGDFEVILMDVQMPEMDGLEATQRIRTLEQQQGTNQHIPIIAMTANAMKGDKEMCLAAGMDGYVSKPVKRNILFAEIERVLSMDT
jgi:PAS domain S-box-containing protein